MSDISYPRTESGRYDTILPISTTLEAGDQAKNATSSYSSSSPSDTSAAKPPIPLPSINLPKSGGAISSIGEKFTAESATGMGTLTIPIATSAADSRGNFAPPLSLTYNSGAGNGVFGIGWEVPLGSITRKTDLGLPRYFDDIPGDSVGKHDVFILAGHEDLVPELSFVGNGIWKPLPPETRTINSIQYSVYQYRSRVEPTVERIERWTTSDGDSHWRTISADNVTAWYGSTTNSRIYDPNDARKVFSWLLCETKDDRGNRYTIEYKAEDSVGVDVSQANEFNRTSLSRSANRYPKRIKYGNLTSSLISPDDTQWMFEVVFDYGEHDLQVPTPNDTGDWLVRQDPFSSYRSGFEVRTYRLCQRILMFHNFPDEPGVGSDCLVKSTDLIYGLPQGAALGTVLSAVTISSYLRTETGYKSATLPPIEFTYSRATFDSTIHAVDPESLENLPIGVDGRVYQFVDLNGEGVEGVLTEIPGGPWMYKSPLGDGKLGPIQKLPLKSTLSRLISAQLLTDLDGSGKLDVVRFDAIEKGFSRRVWEDGKPLWLPFVKFHSIPNVNWNDSNLRFIDLTGDGRSDILITENDALRWYPSLGSEGYGDSSLEYNALDEESGPRLVFSDYINCIFLADMTGDGLVDLVRIRCGELCYWPNMGYGRFGSKISMDNTPWLDTPDQWSSSRVRLADIDGNGTADLIYLGQAGVSIYLNESGNRWTDGETLPIFPVVDNWSSVQVVDFLGNGTACLVWSSSITAGSRMRYVDLMGSTKSNLLISIVNNLGAETRIHYAPSTKYYMADKANGKAWITNIPFPIYVIDKVETYDYIGRTYHSCRYHYHHGYYDGVEREFRGFGMVEQLDTEHLDALDSNTLSPAPPVNLNHKSQVPPVLTKTWFHTGLWRGDGRISKVFENEYWHEPSGLTDAEYQRMRLADTQLPTSAMLRDGTIESYAMHPNEAREACRAIRGSAVRQEIYALDDSDKENLPYLVIENNFGITLLQPRGIWNQHSVFKFYPLESLSIQYERYMYKDPVSGRRLCSPRVSHGMTLEVDRFNFVTRAVAINYGQRQPEPDPSNIITPADRLKQLTAVVTYQEHNYTNAISTPDINFLPLPYESRQYELRGIEQDRSDPLITALFSIDTIKQCIAQAADGSHDLLFEDFDGTGAVPGQVFRRLIGRTRTLYQADDLSGPLPLGTLEARGLTFQTFEQAFTPETLQEVYVNSGKIPDAVALEEIISGECKYVHSEGDDNWWIPSGRVFYSPDPSDTPAQELQYALAHYFLPQRYRDPFYSATFSTESFIKYDKYTLLPLESVDALGNRSTAGQRDTDPTQPLVKIGIDYRLLMANIVMDSNENMTLYSYDILGMVAGVAKQGKPGQNVGDSLNGFIADLSEAAIADYFADPISQGPSLLGTASTRIVYDVWAYYRTKSQENPTPVVASSIFRETHVSDLPAGETSSVLQSVAYSDGFARIVQSKKHTEPGPVPQRDSTTGKIIIGPDGQPVMTTTPVDPRWLVDGWTVFNNKGLPIRQYEPFFTDTLLFEFAVMVGVSSIIFYDPIGRTVGVLNPNHTYSKMILAPWRKESWDLNDTVLISDPKTDPDIGDYFSRLPDDDYLPTWYAQRETGALGPEQQQCALMAAVHAKTPTVTHLDTIGGVFLSVSENAFQYSDAPPGTPVSTEVYTSRVDVDVQGNRRRLFDSQNRLVATDNYGMLGQPVNHKSMDAGQRWSLVDISANVKYSWDERGYRFRLVVDQLQRPIETYQQLNAQPEVLTERAVYGESEASPEVRNARLKLIRFYDQAGVYTNEDYDFKGNSLNGGRTLTQSYKDIVDWKGSVALESRTFVSSTSYDALNRPRSMTLPDNSIVYPTYNLENRINNVKINLQGSAQLTTFVSAIEYTAKGQRSSITFGNGVTTTFQYDRLTNRLTSMLTRRDPQAYPGDCPQPQVPAWPGCQIQNLLYTDDPMGNTTSIRDDAQQTIFFRNVRVEPSNTYIYDAVYRLIEATGREHLGQTAGNPSSPTPSSPYDTGQTGLAHPNDGRAMGTYLERYIYDSSGNITSFRHIGSNPTSPGWTRLYTYKEISPFDPTTFNNRLTSTQVGSSTEIYGYDTDAGLHGSITSMPHLSLMAFDSRDQLQKSSNQVVNNGTPEITYYVYDSGGERVRKVTERQSDANTTPTRKSQTVYIGGFEVYTEYAMDGDTITLERESLHVTDGTTRVAIVETRTQGSGSRKIPAQLFRYQISNRLRSVSIELDETGQVISYEEYTPYGPTSYQGVSSQLPPAKKYRYAGKERDTQTGFYYNGARYYLPWLSRWASADPAGLRDGPNVFTYTNNNPVGRGDPTGTDGKHVSIGLGKLPKNEKELREQLLHTGPGYIYTGHAKQVSPGHWEVVGGKLYPLGPQQDQSASGEENGNGSSPPGTPPQGTPGGSPEGGPTGSTTGVPNGNPDGSPTGSDSGKATDKDATSSGGPPSEGGGAGTGPEERSWWSRGGGTLVLGAIVLALGVVALLFNPVGWLALASGLLAVAAGGFGVGHGLTHLALSGSTTAEEDEHMNQTASTVMTFIGSIGGLVGGTIGYIRTGTVEGLDEGAFWGSLVEGVGMLTKGFVPMLRMEARFGFFRGLSTKWKNVSPRIQRLLGNGTAASRMRSSPFFKKAERLELSHFIARKYTKGWEWLFNRPWNVKAMWEREHMLLDPDAYNFATEAFEQAFGNLRVRGLQRWYQLAPKWMQDALFHGGASLARRKLEDAPNH